MRLWKGILLLSSVLFCTSPAHSQCQPDCPDPGSGTAGVAAFAAACDGCSSTDNPATTCNGGFSIELVDCGRDGDLVTYTYEVCKLTTGSDLSHWVIALGDVDCLAAGVSLADLVANVTQDGNAAPFAVGVDPTTQVSGFKFDIGGSGCHTYAVTFDESLLADGFVLGKSTVVSATKAGNQDIQRADRDPPGYACVLGPICIQQLGCDPPDISCPPDVSLSCSDSTDPNSTGFATAQGDCPPVTVTFEDSEAPGACAAARTITRTWTATDDSGQTATCDQTITVSDDDPPLITCPADVTVGCDDPTDPNSTGVATATDGCDQTPDVSFTDSVQQNACGRVITRTWTATDDCGNMASCVQTITVSDDDPPVITCPADVTVGCDDPTDPNSTGVATATDGCDDTPDVSFSDSVQQNACGRVITRTWTATDDCGNMATCIQTITVSDDVAPEITCPDDFCVTAPDQDGVVVSFQVDVSDACDPNVQLECTPPSGSVFPLGVTVVTCVATDCAGNRAECSFEVEVKIDPTTVSGCATKFVDGDFIQGGAVVYTIVLSHESESAMPDGPGMEFVDVLPAQLTMEDAWCTSGDIAIYDPLLRKVGWSGEIPPGDGVTIWIAARINHGTGGQVCNQGMLYYTSAGPFGRPTDDPDLPGREDRTCFVIPGSTPSEIPTLSEWGLIALMSLFGLALVRRKIGA